MSMDALVGELQCPICLELLRHPTILPCSHILCRDPCAQRLFNRDFVRCPVCRENSFVSGGLEALPLVISLQNIIESYRDGVENMVTTIEGEVCREGEIACQLCEDPPRRAYRSCLACNASYCQRCLELSHPPKTPFSEHQLVKPRRYPKPREQRCPLHDIKVNIYCLDCGDLACLLCADDPNAHPNHHVLGLEQADQRLREQIDENLRQADASQGMFTDAIQTRQDRRAEFQRIVEERRALVNEQCNSLIAEIETKREFFLSDLEYEEKKRTDKLVQQVCELEQHGAQLQSTVHFARQSLRETDKCAFIQLAKTVNEKMKASLGNAGDLALPPMPWETLQNKMVDLRRERALIRDMAYLAIPSVPVIDVTKCSRSANSVVLVLSPPVNDYDVIDGYYVYLWTDEEQGRNEEDKLCFKTPRAERLGSRGPTSTNMVCLIPTGLESDTKYFFNVRAYNIGGQSDTSAIVNCTTLSADHSSMQAPEIVEAQCRTYTYSIQVYSSSPVETSADPNTSYYLMYRESSEDKVWKSVHMYGRLDHRVFGLESDSPYDFVVMACDNAGECQLSNTVTLNTERAAY